MAHSLMAAALLVATVGTGGAATEGATVESAVASTPEEMLLQSKNTVSFVQDATRRAKKIRDQAEKEGDTKLLDCIIGPSNSLNTLQGVATKRYEDLSGMVADGDSTNAGRVYRSMVILRDKASALISQAEACTADGQLQAGNSLVNSNQDGVTSNDETSPLLSDEPADIDPPPTSPFQ